MIAHEKGFKFHAQPQTGEYSCFTYKWKSVVEKWEICSWKNLN